MDKKRQDIAYFISFCIEKYKSWKNLSGADAVLYLDKYGVLDYLKEHYEILHTQGAEWIMEDIDEFIAVRTKEGK